MGDSTFFIKDNVEHKTKAKYNNLYVGNVDKDVTEDEIREYFGKFGEIESILIPTRLVNTSSGEKIQVRKTHIFISFKDPNVASTVIKEVDNRYVWNRVLNINYYDPSMSTKKKNEATAASAPAPEPNTAIQNMAQEFMQAMVMAASQFQNNSMRGGRGGYSNNRGGSYRGGGHGGNRGGGTRGMHHRGSRGHRGGGRGAHYQVKSSYEQKPMMGHGMTPPPMPMMGHGMPPPASSMPSAPPMASPNYGDMDSNPSYGGGNMNPGMPHGMAPSHGGMQTAPQPMQTAPPVQAPTIPQPQPPPVETHDADQNDDGEEHYTLEELLNMSKDDADNAIGTVIYNKLEPRFGSDDAGKITGMFLDIDLKEVYQIAYNEEARERYIGEALMMLDNPNHQQPEAE